MWTCSIILYKSWGDAAFKNSLCAPQVRLRGPPVPLCGSSLADAHGESGRRQRAHPRVLLFPRVPGEHEWWGRSALSGPHQQLLFFPFQRGWWIAAALLWLGFDLGRLQISQDHVADVLLPRWAASREDFIRMHMKALVRLQAAACQSCSFSKHDVTSGLCQPPGIWVRLQPPPWVDWSDLWLQTERRRGCKSP